MEIDSYSDKIIGYRPGENLIDSVKLSDTRLNSLISEFDDLKAKANFLENEVKDLKRINKRRPAKWTSR